MCMYCVALRHFDLNADLNPSDRLQNLSSRKIYFTRCIVIIYSLIWFRNSPFFLRSSISFDYYYYYYYYYSDYIFSIGSSPCELHTLADLLASVQREGVERDRPVNRNGRTYKFCFIYFDGRSETRTSAHWRSHQKHAFTSSHVSP